MYAERDTFQFRNKIFKLILNQGVFNNSKTKSILSSETLLIL